MAGWSREKREKFEEAFYVFLNNCFVNSKNTGFTCLGENLYDGQVKFITTVLDGLENDIHKFYVLKSRQLGLCYDPRMRCLTADLNWVPIGDLKIGTELVAVDEFPPGGRGAGRKMRTARVQAIKEVFAPAYSVSLSNGVTLIATAEHRHLCKVRGAVHTEWRSVGDTVVGDEIRYITSTWETGDYEDGWFGGFIDGEGSISLPARSGAYLGVSQVPGAVLERARKYLENHEIGFREEIDRRKAGTSSKFGNKPVHKFVVRGMSDLFYLLGKTRPTRFIGNRWWENKELPGKRRGNCWATVISITPLGKRRMLDIQTSEKTFICEGIVSHNSTISRALSVFYIGVHKGISGALVFDTAPNRELARVELEAMIDDLPAKLKFPAVKATNREGLTLVTKSKILFKAAGVKKSAGSGGLGRSAGLSMAHLSELCSFTDPEGLESFENSLSDEHPDRLYIYESTARGFNLWHELWTEARKDTAHCACLFLGWWSHNGQEVKRDHPDFQLYGTTPPTAKEAEKIRIVRERYGVEITPEKLAWIRRKMDPTATREGDADPEFEGNSLRVQEQPWTEEEAFQQTGSVFFPQQTLTEITHKNVSNKYSSWMFLAGSEFADMKVIKAPNTRNIDLRIWEEPDPDGVYAVGIDPAFGENEYNDRSSIEVFRCYADGFDQVAEYASPLINTRQLAWVIATIIGYYGSGPNSIVKYALELNGPGTAVFNEIRALKSLIDSGLQPQIEEKGLQNVFRNVRTYIYTRPDSMGSGQNYHIKTTGPLKITFLERFRDFVTNGTCRIRSIDLIDEMKTVAREGDSIKAPGNMKDDRVLSSSFAGHVWETGLRKMLMTQRRTRDAEAARKRMSIVDQVSLFQQNQLQTFFDQKKRLRTIQQRAAIKQAWRYR